MPGTTRAAAVGQEVNLSGGNVTLVVDMLHEGKEEEDSSVAPDNLLVEAVASNTWEDAIRGLAFDRNRCPPVRRRSGWSLPADWTNSRIRR